MSARPPHFHPDPLPHAEAVDALFAARSQGAPLDLLQNALSSLWRRAERIMGAVTLAAITERVLHDVSKRFDFIDDVTIAEAGINLDMLRSRAASLPSGDVDAAARLILTRFLGVLGSLTADVLTPALHGELTKLHEGELS